MRRKFPPKNNHGANKSIRKFRRSFPQPRQFGIGLARYDHGAQLEIVACRQIPMPNLADDGRFHAQDFRQLGIGDFLAGRAEFGDQAVYQADSLFFGQVHVHGWKILVESHCRLVARQLAVKHFLSFKTINANHFGIAVSGQFFAC